MSTLGTKGFTICIPNLPERVLNPSLLVFYTSKLIVMVASCAVDPGILAMLVPCHRLSVDKQTPKKDRKSPAYSSTIDVALVVYSTTCMCLEIPSRQSRRQ